MSSLASCSSSSSSSDPTGVSSLNPEQKAHLLDSLRSFCIARGISTSSTLALTVMANRSTQFSSIVVNLGTGNILSGYPDPDACSSYKEGRIGEYLFCYNDQLTVRADEQKLLAGQAHVDPSSSSSSSSSAQPFCCPGSSLTPWKARRLDREQLFTQFLTGRGHCPSVVFEVMRQVDQGPELSRTHWTLLHDRIAPAPEGKYTQKLHAFKNYKCARHGLFFAVDLFQPLGSSAGWNAYHMRLVPRTHIEREFLEGFFREAAQTKQ